MSFRPKGEILFNDSKDFSVTPFLRNDMVNIPAGSISKLVQSCRLNLNISEQSRWLLQQQSTNNNVLHPPDFYEDTHLEIIDAQKVMSDYGLNSAIFISSPYHMRRIKLIAAKAFDLNKGGFYFVPTRYEKVPVNYWELSSADWKKVRREYGKILWFYIYFTWSHNSW